MTTFGGTLAQAMDWMNTQDTADDLTRGELGPQVSAASNGHYGGIWFDNQTRRVKVGITSGANTGAVQTALANHGLSGKADLVTVDHTIGELEDAQGTFNSQTATFMADGKLLTSRDLPQNAVIAETAASLTAAETSQIAAYAASASARSILTPSTANGFAGEEDQGSSTLTYCEYTPLVFVRGLTQVPTVKVPSAVELPPEINQDQHSAPPASMLEATTIKSPTCLRQGTAS